MAAGLGTRLRPLTERWPKPILPVDGRPVIVTLLHELAGGRLRLLRRRHRPSGRADRGAARRRFPTGSGSSRSPSRSAPPTQSAARRREPPFLVTAADTVYARGDPGRFWRASRRAARPGRSSMRRQPGRPVGTRIRAEGGRVVRVVDPTDESGLTAAPLMAVGPAVAAADRGRPAGAAVRAGRRLPARRSMPASVSRRSKSGRRET